MKVLFLAFPGIGMAGGGLAMQIRKTAEGLSSLGVDVVFYDPWRDQIKDVDICHFFGPPASMSYHAKRASDQNRPMVVSPVLNCFADARWKTKTKVWLSKNIPGMLTEVKQSSTILQRADRVLPLNMLEQEVLTGPYNVPTENCRIVPNGINKNFLSGNPDLFREKYRLTECILEVGAIGPRKNQLTLIKAMKNLPYKLVLIGPADISAVDYLDQCKEAAGDNVIFAGEISNDDPLLASAFCCAKLFVLPSYSEVMPLTLYEAAIAGCKIIASKNFPIEPAIEKYVPRIDPDQPKALASVIAKEMQTPRNGELTRLARKMPTWLDVAKQLKGIYDDVLGKN